MVVYGSIWSRLPVKNRVCIVNAYKIEGLPEENKTVMTESQFSQEEQNLENKKMIP